MKAKPSRIHKQKGYVLLSVMLLITLMIIAMSIEVPRIKQQIKREKEEEMVHRGKEYAMAVKRYYHKTGQYPTTLDQLENTNNVRFLRKKYEDPMTGKADWKLVHQGEATIKIPPPGTQPGGSGTLPPGAGGPLTQGGGGIGPGATPTPSPSPSPNPSGRTPTLQNTPPGSIPAQQGTGIIGVVSTSKDTAIKEFNDKTHYNEWLFVFDPRLEQSGGSGIVVAESSGSGAAGATQGGLGSLPTSGLPPPGTAPTPIR